MVNRVGVSKPDATVCPSSTARLMTTPSMGEVMVAYDRVALRFCQRCLTAFVAAFPLSVIVDGLLVVGIADKLLFVQSPVAFVVLPLIFVFGFRTVVGGALGCHFALQGHGPFRL